MSEKQWKESRLRREIQKDRAQLVWGRKRGELNLKLPRGKNHPTEVEPGPCSEN
jgi:hypothetical protein